MNSPKKQRAGAQSQLYERGRGFLFSTLPTEVTVLCLMFLSFLDCTRLSTASTAFLAMTTTAQSLMESTDHRSATLKSNIIHVPQFFHAVLKKCSSRRLSAIIFPLAKRLKYGTKQDVQPLNQILKEFPKIQTLQMHHLLLRHLKDPKPLQKINALSITAVCVWQLDLPSVWPGLTTLALIFSSPDSFGLEHVLETITQLEHLTTLTLRFDSDRFMHSADLEAVFHDLETTPFKTLKRLSLCKHICSNLQSGWLSLSKITPHLEELHAFFPLEGSHVLVHAIWVLRLKIISLHFPCWVEKFMYKKLQNETDIFMKALSKISYALERLDFMNVSDKQLELFTTLQPNVGVKRHCHCDFLGAIRGSCRRRIGSVVEYFEDQHDV